jgi:hypothetical protein
MVNMYENTINFHFKIANKLFNWGFPVKLPDLSNCNLKIIELVKENTYDVIWIDKGWLVEASTLAYIKKLSPKTKIVSYTADNMALRHNQSQQFLEGIPLYDIHFTTKSYIIEDLENLGAKKVLFTNKHYEDSFHFPRDLTVEEIDRLGGDVGFIGAWEKERCESILFLAKNGIKVKVFGGGKWKEFADVKNLEVQPSVFSEDYSKALQAFKISLCFLRKMNFDQQTSRTMEIPACGGFMLAERTDEHLSLFQEGKEAEYFSSNEELLKKCKYYLLHEEERKSIAVAGRKRCETSGYSNKEAIKRMLDEVTG